MQDLWHRLEGERGTPLPPALLRQMEAAFNHDFAHVRIHVSPLAAAACAAAGGLACTDGQRIAFMPGVYQPESAAGRWVIAHELAHVVQKGGGRMGSVMLGAHEAQADAAADAFLLGAPVCALSRDATRDARCWGEPGHYYTVYFCALCADIEPQLAFQLAYLAQLPDEVSELDALELGLKWAAEKRLFSRERTVPANYSGKFVTQERPKLNYSSENTMKWLNLQRGIHCLTGAPANVETKKRAAILRNHDIKSIEFGLGLHAYGDSWAHRSGDHMYHAPLGHYGAHVDHSGVRHEHRNKADEKKGCAVDKIHYRVDDYVAYGLGLWNILKEKNPLRGFPRVHSRWSTLPNLLDQTGMKTELEKIASIQDDEKQIAHMRARVTKLTNKIMREDYTPESFGWALPWCMLDTVNLRPLLGRDVGRLEAIGLSWASMSRDEKPVDRNVDLTRWGGDPNVDPDVYEVGREMDRLDRAAQEEVFRDELKENQEELAQTLKKHRQEVEARQIDHLNRTHGD